MLTIQEAVNQIKALIEYAIVKGGVEGKNNLIRTQVPICMLHDAAKAEFIRNGINPNLVAPIYGEHVGEQKLAGFFKCKDQDICFMPNNYNKVEETLNFDGILKGKKDSFGHALTEHILSVNVRSQLSSTAKNFDTLYERTFAEALNLHLRCPKMVLGEFYMIPVYEYDDSLAKDYRVGFKKNKNISKHLEKYIYSFNAVNGRTTTNGEDYKYERVCLLIVDFNRKTPKIYNTNAELIADNLLPANTTASIDNMNFPTFAKELMKIYEQRFGKGRFI
ncbi:MAG: restriction endonuclease [Bacteroidales bacterium]|nr:restriction endonuclease [Bacteroidales bacterium]